MALVSAGRTEILNVLFLEVSISFIASLMDMESLLFLVITRPDFERFKPSYLKNKRSNKGLFWASNSVNTLIPVERSLYSINSVISVLSLN